MDTEGSLVINMSCFCPWHATWDIYLNQHDGPVIFSPTLLVIVYYIQGAKSTLKHILAVFTLNFIAILS